MLRVDGSEPAPMLNRIEGLHHVAAIAGTVKRLEPIE